MGLDMYLSMEIEAPQDSSLAKVIEKCWTEQHTAQVTPGESPPSVYISGWGWPAMNGHPEQQPDPMFTAISQEIGFTPHSGSPHFIVIKRLHGGYTVQGTLYYWRKANEIHRWFVDTCQDGVDDCEEYEVHPEQLMDLIDRCEQITVDHSLAQDLLPTQGGFFFGSTDYDEWYFNDLEETAINLKAQMLVCPRGARLVYRSSW